MDGWRSTSRLTIPRRTPSRGRFGTIRSSCLIRKSSSSSAKRISASVPSPDSGLPQGHRRSSDVFRLYVFADLHEDRVAQTSVAGPLGVGGLAHQHWLHPVGEPLGTFHDRRIERTLFLRERIEAIAKLDGERV